MNGVLALVGGAEWRERCTFDAELLDASGGRDVLIVPTASAYEHPQRAVDWAKEWFSTLGAKARGLMVLRRSDAEDEANADVIRSARFIYIGGGSPLHLRSVLKDSPCWDALVSAWQSGAVLAGSSAGAMVLCDPMVDPRGGAFTLGLGLIEQLAILPHADTWSHDKMHRTIQLAAAGLTVATIAEQTALIRDPGGAWRTSGAGNVAVWQDGHEVGLAALPG
jgi:cyanophycinase